MNDFIHFGAPHRVCYELRTPPFSSILTSDKNEQWNSAQPWKVDGICQCVPRNYYSNYLGKLQHLFLDTFTREYNSHLPAWLIGRRRMKITIHASYEETSILPYASWWIKILIMDHDNPSPNRVASGSFPINQVSFSISQVLHSTHLYTP